MFIINISQIETLVLVLIFTMLAIYLGRETKKSIIPGLVLFAYLLLLLSYIIQLSILNSQDIVGILTKCIAINFMLILQTYLGYLWVDNISAKKDKKKTINDGLDWLWGKV